MRKKGLGILSVGLLLTACSASTADAEGGEDGGLPAKITIGVPLDVSGAAGIAGVGTSERDGVKLAAAEINETGFLGDSTIDLVEIDTKADKQEAVQAALQLTSQEVDAVVGFTLTPSFLAAAPNLQQAGIPTMAVGLSAGGVTEVGDYMFRLYPNMVDVIPPGDVDFAEAFGDVKTAAYISQSDSESAAGIASARQAALEDKGIKTVAKQTFVGTDTDVRAQLTEIKRAKPDLLVATPLPGMMSLVYLQLNEVGFDGQVIVAPDPSADQLQAAGPAMECFVYTSAWNPKSTEGNNAHFIEYWDQHGADRAPTVFEAAGYASLWSMAEAIKKADTTDKAAVRDALADLDGIDSPFGKIGFTDDRAASIKGTKLQIQSSKLTIFDSEKFCKR